MLAHDPLRAALEIREQLASEKRKLSFLFGAGTSMAIGVPGIITLTQQIADDLNEPYKAQFNSIKLELGENANVETILDRIRAISELMGDSDAKIYDGIVGATAAKGLDTAVCQMISDKIRAVTLAGNEPQIKFDALARVAKWITV